MLFFDYTQFMIKPALFALLLSALVAVPDNAQQPHSGACYNIADGDARSYCLARVHRERSQCYNIRQPDMRAWCLSEVSK